MKARLSSILGALVAIAIVAIGTWVLVRGVLDQPTIVSSFVTAAGAVGAVVYQRDRENRREVAALHREKLAPMYEQLFVHFRDGISLETPEQQDFIYKLQRELLFYGSTPVVVEWLRWLRSIPNVEDGADESDDDDGPTDPTVLLRWERVLLAIPRDLGHDNRSLNPGDLLRIYVNDADEHIQPWLAAGNQLEPD